MYQPRTSLPDSPKDLTSLVRWALAFAAWVLVELQNIAREFEADKPAARFKVLYAQPARVFAAMVVYADGTEWDPGAGEGLYVRNAANTAWSKL
jgi:hypothetical protein